MKEENLEQKNIIEGRRRGETKTRELLRNPTNGFTIRIGNRLYAHKGKLDIWLKNQIL